MIDKTLKIVALIVLVPMWIYAVVMVSENKEFSFLPFAIAFPIYFMAIIP